MFQCEVSELKEVNVRGSLEITTCFNLSLEGVGFSFINGTG